MQQIIGEARDQSRNELVDLSKLIAWPCLAALVTFIVCWLLPAINWDAVWAISLCVGTLTYCVLMLSQATGRFSKDMRYLLNLFSLVGAFAWCILAGFALADATELSVFKLLGFIVPLLLVGFCSRDVPVEDEGEEEFRIKGDVVEVQEDLQAFFSRGEFARLEAAIPHIEFAGLKFPTESSRKQNFLVVGSIGTGKSIILKQMMQSVLPAIGGDCPLRAVVYDAKNELMPFLTTAISTGSPIYSMNPNFQGAFCWDIAKDCRTVNDTIEMSIALVPRRPGAKAGSFFTDISRQFSSVTMLSLKDCRGDDWDLLDLIDTLLDKQARNQILNASPEGRRLLGNLGSSDTEANVLSTLESHFGGMRPFAMAMRNHALEGRKLSINDWVTSKSVLVLGGRTKVESPLAAINRAIIERIKDALLDVNRNPTSKENRTFLFLDEYADFGRLDAMAELLRLGRDFGVCTTLVFQSISELDNAYEGNSWEGLLSHVCNRVFLRINDPKTAEWASKLLGNHEVEPGKTVTMHKEGESETETIGGPKTYQPIIHPDSLMSLDVVEKRGVGGFVTTPLSKRVAKFLLPRKDIFRTPSMNARRNGSGALSTKVRGIPRHSPRNVPRIHLSATMSLRRTGNHCVGCGGVGETLAKTSCRERLPPRLL